MNSAVSAASVHGDCYLTEFFEAALDQVTSLLHSSDDISELQEVHVLTADQGLTFEEWDYLVDEVVPVTNHEHETSISSSSVILTDPSAVHPMRYEVEDLPALRVLADMELGYELPSQPCRRIALDRDVKRTFSVDVSRYVGIQSFLLIFRTDRIVTAHFSRLMTA